MSSETPDPLHQSQSTPLSAISKTVYSIAGIKTTVYGLEEIPRDVSEIACVWLLHPRGGTDESMTPIATASITNWNIKRKSNDKGLIAVAFDQRNHGIRLVDSISNETWKKGNPRHAQDMYSIYQGTAEDTSLLLSHLPSYLPSSVPALVLHLVLGISLGGHAAWHCVLHDSRIRAACIIIGCPDYARLMAHRAFKSKLPDWNTTPTPGSKFFGSPSFPKSLIENINYTDPAGLLLPDASKAQNLPPFSKVSPKSFEPNSINHCIQLLNKTLQGKAVLNLAGAADKLVPHDCAKPFIKYLKYAKETFWNQDGKSFFFRDRAYDGVKHEVSPEMFEAAVNFIADVLSGKTQVKSNPQSRI